MMVKYSNTEMLEFEMQEISGNRDTFDLSPLPVVVAIKSQISHYNQFNS